ncbi:MAG: o-succinylbenzoate synthase [Dehalococcoidia bacterium]|nr:o-succinylbenzoate synthase [Dehalococcoidia bacterium]
MRLTGVSWRGYALPFRKGFAAHKTQADVRWGMLVFLRSDEGLLGVGEASPVGLGSEEEIRRIASALEGLAPGLLARDLSPAEVVSVSSLPPHLRFGIETALLDLEGQKLGCPIVTLLGGRPAQVAVNALIAVDSPERAAIEARQAVEEGFTAIKLKVGQRGPDLDEALVVAVRTAAGHGIKLRLDPNQAWDVDHAIEAARRLSRYDLEYIEQPVASEDIAGLAAVRRGTSVPIAADESLGSLDDLRQLLSADAADVFIIKAARLGGLAPALEIARAAVLAARRVAVTTSLESGVGIAASLHLAAALPSQAVAHGLATGTLFVDDLVSPRLSVEQGRMETPCTPGLGVKVSADLLEKYCCGIKGSAGSLSGLD